MALSVDGLNKDSEGLMYLEDPAQDDNNKRTDKKNKTLYLNNLIVPSLQLDVNDTKITIG